MKQQHATGYVLRSKALALVVVVVVVVVLLVVVVAAQMFTKKGSNCGNLLNILGIVLAHFLFRQWWFDVCRAQPPHVDSGTAGFPLYFLLIMVARLHWRPHGHLLICSSRLALSWNMQHLLWAMGPLPLYQAELHLFWGLRLTKRTRLFLRNQIFFVKDHPQGHQPPPRDFSAISALLFPLLDMCC